jgi:hypothetical protein
MGQPVTVIEKPSATAGVVRYETNRVLTGTGHEGYRSREDAFGHKWCDELARRLFDRGGLASVHMNGNVVTVHLLDDASAEGIKEIVEDMFLYYREGVVPEIPAGAATDS